MIREFHGIITFIRKDIIAAADVAHCHQIGSIELLCYIILPVYTHCTKGWLVLFAVLIYLAGVYTIASPYKFDGHSIPMENLLKSDL